MQNDEVVYKIWDKVELKYISGSRNGRSVWGGKGAAKQVIGPYAHKRGRKPDEFDIYKFELVFRGVCP